MALDSPSSFRNWKTSFFFVSGVGYETVPCENLDDAPKFLHSWGTPMSNVSFYSFSSYAYDFFFFFFFGDTIASFSFFEDSIHPRLKK